MNKIPVLNLLKWNLILGTHVASTLENKPYREFTIGFDKVGFGKFRIFRLDYIRAFQDGFTNDGIMFGVKL